MSEDRIAHRRILLTGATGGIGRTLAGELAGRADMLVLSGRDVATLNPIEDQHPDRVRRLAADLADPASLLRLADGVQQAPGSIDTLIHCAGVNRFGRFDRMSDDEIDRLIAVNLVAPIQLTRRLLPALLAGQRPTIVFVGSALGRIGYPGQAVYCAAKAGLHRFAEALRREFDDAGLQVLHVAPRATATEFNSPGQRAANRELKVAEDSPERVADRIVRAMASGRTDSVLGFPEKLIARVNNVFPRLFDRALRPHARVMRRHAS